MRSPGPLAAICLAVLMVATGCASAEADGQSQATEPIQLTLAALPGHGLQDLVERWERQRPGIEVLIVESDYDTHHEHVQAAVASGENVPDVAMIEIAYAAKFQALSEGFVNLSERFDADRYLDWRWAHGLRPDGDVFGIPTDVGGLAVAYRIDMFEAAGLPAARDEVNDLWPTWEDFITTGQHFVENSDAAFLDDAASLFEVVLNQSGRQYYDEDGSLIAGENPSIRWARDVAVTAASRGIDSGVTAFSPEWNEGMADGEYAVLLAPAWMMSYIQEQAPATAGLWDIAAIPGRSGNWGGSQLAIPLASDEPELAWDLVRYLLAPDAQLQTFRTYGNFPSTPELYDDPLIVDFSKPFFNDAPLGRIYTESALELEPVILGPNHRHVTRTLGEGVRSVRAGEATPAEAWNLAIAEIVAQHRSG